MSTQKENYIIFNPEGGLGKIIASTAVVRNIRATYPDHKIIVVTPWPEVYLNNPNVERVFRSGNTPYFYKDYIKNRNSIVLKGEPYFNTGHLYNKQQLVKSWCKLHDLKYDGNNLPELFFSPIEARKVVEDLVRDKPVLIMQTNGGMYSNNKKDYCWTRDIPHNQAQILADELSKSFTILHVTRPDCKRLNNTETVNEVDKRTLMLMLLGSQKRLLIDSCLQHAAAALNLQSTVLWVGTHPEVFGYDIHTNIKPAQAMIESNTSYIDSLIFDYDFNGPEYEYPFNSAEVFNLQDVFDSIIKN
tara:strand:- start:813 stop:1718 length:906 start_codon:yes stop_codon:yes gene_type:complete